MGRRGVGGEETAVEEIAGIRQGDHFALALEDPRANRGVLGGGFLGIILPPWLNAQRLLIVLILASSPDLFQLQARGDWTMASKSVSAVSE